MGAPGLAAVLMWAVLAAPAWAAAPDAAEPGPAAPPQLSIGIDNGTRTAAEGDRPLYAVVVRNLGTGPIEALHITQTLPAGLDLVSADAEGTSLNASTVVWSVDLAPGMTATFHTATELHATAPELLNLASVVCASVDADAAPVVCATDSDQLPAGAAAMSAAEEPSDDGGSRRAELTGLGIVVGMAVAVAGLVLVRRSRRA